MSYLGGNLMHAAQRWGRGRGQRRQHANIIYYMREGGGNFGGGYGPVGVA